MIDEHLYDLVEKGKKHDTLKKEYDALKILCDKAVAQRLLAETARDKCIEALKCIVIIKGSVIEFHNINAKSLFKIAELLKNKILNNKLK